MVWFGLGKNHRHKLMKIKSGHIQSHLREAFQEWLDQFGSDFPVSLDAVTSQDGEPMTGRWLIGQLWNCTDTLPNNYCDQLNVAKGSSYASAVRSLSKEFAH